MTGVSDHVLPRHLYVHVPFCARRCSYCDFSIAVRRSAPVDEYLGALERELQLRFRDPGAHDWTLDTVYLGGGTPSALGGEGIGKLFALLRRWASWPVGPGAAAEVTVEANPDDVTPDVVAHWHAAGVNRLSVGAQSFDAAALRWMHRTHGAGAIERAVEHARAGAIDNVSLDLIFGLPAELNRDWAADLRRALQLHPTHVSLYGLTIEPGTPLARWKARGSVSEVTDETYEREFLVAHDCLTAAGHEHYEVSNYALPGHRSRHNSSYWMHAPYVGIGPAAHSYTGGERRWNVGPYAAWVRALRSGRDVVGGSELLTDVERMAEEVYLGLRSWRGVRLTAAEVDRVAPWIDAGWGELHDGTLMLTANGWLRLDALAADLTVSRSR